ncbi:hypothetical protein H072_61 [Dactylellina haptotyla CBS 200.50]|uniref:F-box domain-containing protein n=1 Tax=Dactylellina haptotyla (strain CBS 200.50) TaxID=1284197 RepID=S8AYC1_DACHA|nr:hypothetical protein H072_61 [Dactylellina haptotyla CBS 200.50]
MECLPFLFFVQGNLKPICKRFYAHFSPLPAKIWEQIFSNIDYLALLKVKETCNDFQYLLQNTRRPALLAKLFREKAPSETDPNYPLPHGTRVSLHPVLEKIKIIRDASDLTIYTADGVIPWAKAYPFEENKLPGFNENASSPPVRIIELGIWSYDPVFMQSRTEDSKGLPLTVGDFYKLMHWWIRTRGSVVRFAFTRMIGGQEHFTVREVVFQHAFLDDRKIVKNVADGKVQGILRGEIAERCADRGGHRVPDLT